MHAQLLDLKLAAGGLLAVISGAVAASPVDHALLQYGALGVLALSIVYILRIVVPQFLNKLWESHAQHIEELRKANDRYDARLGELTDSIKSHARSNRELVEKVGKLIERCPAFQAERDR